MDKTFFFNCVFILFDDSLLSSILKLKVTQHTTHYCLVDNFLLHSIDKRSTVCPKYLSYKTHPASQHYSKTLHCMAAYIFYSRAQEVMLLIEKDANPDNTNKDYQTALPVATDTEHYPCDGSTPQTWSLDERDGHTWTKRLPPISWTVAVAPSTRSRLGASTTVTVQMQGDGQSLLRVQDMWA